MVRVTLHVHPGARLEAVRHRGDGSLDIHVRAPALEGRANTAVLRLLATALRLRPRQLRLLRGEHARLKLVELDLADSAELDIRLAATVPAGGGAKEFPLNARGPLVSGTRP